MRIVKRRRRGPVIAVALLLAAAGYAVWCLQRPLPSLAPQVASRQLQLATPDSKLHWPASQAAVGLVNTDILESHGAQTPAATASTAKVITALVVLQKYPLAANEAGPLITLTADDVARYNAYVKQDGSVVRVQAGEQISQYQMLQTLMLPSANNLADSLAIWAYGSLPAYAKAANAYLADRGLTGTHVGSDASGLAPDTTSTAHDLVKIGELAMKTPVLAQIAGQSTATGIPVVGTIKNVNSLLGTAGIIGIKTGNSDHAGGAFIGAAQVIVNDQPQIIVTAVVNAPDLAAAMKDSLTLIQSAQTNFEPVSVIELGDTLGYYALPWGGRLDAIAGEDLKPSAWGGSPVTATVKLNRTDNTPQGDEIVGQLTTAASHQKIAIKLKTTPTTPPIWWLLTHPIR